MAHLSLGCFQPPTTTLPPNVSAPPHAAARPPLSNGHRRLGPSVGPPPISISAPLPVLPFHLFSPGAHQWFFSAAALSGGGDASGSETATVDREEAQDADRKKTRLIAQNIPWTCTCDDIRSMFLRHGTVEEVELSMHNSTRNRGLAFITMGSEEEAAEALNNLNLYEMDGRVIKVEYARSAKKKQPAPAGPVTKHNVFVGNLTYKARSRDLRELFTSFNPNVLSVEVIFQPNPRRSAGYGFASFASVEEAEAAVAALSGAKLLGRAVRLVLGKKEADPLMEEATDKLEGKATGVNESDPSLSN